MLMGQYLEILEESLRKKIELLDRILKYNQDQEGLFEDPTSELERYDDYIEEKGRMTEELEKLDDGFESLYERVSEELKAGREMYADSIRRMQELIRQISEKTASVQAQEARMKASLERNMEARKAEIGRVRRSVQASRTYRQGPGGQQGNEYK